MGLQNRAKTKRKAPPHAWKEGQSGNPGGRPRGLGRYIREKLGEDGKAIADFAIAIIAPEMDASAEGEAQGFGFNEKKWAAEFLRDTGWGRPAAAQDEAETPAERPRAVDPKRLTTEQLRALDELDAIADCAEAVPETDDVH